MDNITKLVDKTHNAFHADFEDSVEKARKEIKEMGLKKTVIITLDTNDDCYDPCIFVTHLTAVDLVALFEICKAAMVKEIE